MLDASERLRYRGGSNLKRRRAGGNGEVCPSRYLLAGYFLDPAGNTSGLFQVDENAKQNNPGL
jgi:hypothetical protein